MVQSFSFVWVSVCKSLPECSAERRVYTTSIGNFMGYGLLMQATTRMVTYNVTHFSIWISILTFLVQLNVNM
jgi:hypothetical protein